MAASEAPDAMLQFPESVTGEAATMGTETWPPDVEVCVEYCTRSPFHARYDPDKYLEYYQAVSDAFLARSPQTKIVGNPFTGRKKIWTACDQFGPIPQDLELPRLGAFEVTMDSVQTGCVTIFSKLTTRRWPNAKILVVQVDRLLRGEDMLQPLPTPSPRLLSESRSPRKRIPPKTDGGGFKSSMSPGSTPRSAAASSPERSASVGKSSPRVGASSKKAGRKEEPVAEEMAQSALLAADSQGVAADAAVAATAQTIDAASTIEIEDRIGYEGEEFEGEESGEGSSCFGTKVWMPGASKHERWEDDNTPPDSKKGSMLSAADSESRRTGMDRPLTEPQDPGDNTLEIVEALP